MQQTPARSRCSRRSRRCHRRSVRHTLTRREFSEMGRHSEMDPVAAVFIALGVVLLVFLFFWQTIYVVQQVCWSSETA